MESHNVYATLCTMYSGNPPPTVHRNVREFVHKPTHMIRGQICMQITTRLWTRLHTWLYTRTVDMNVYKFGSRYVCGVVYN